MFARYSKQVLSRAVTRRRFATEVKGPAETSKKFAQSYFDKIGMWPLILLTVGVGFIGYQYRRNFINLVPERYRKDHKTVEEIRSEARSEADFTKKLGQQVDRERDKGSEKYWSKGTLEKGAFENSPEGLPSKKPSSIRE